MSGGIYFLGLGENMFFLTGNDAVIISYILLGVLTKHYVFLSVANQAGKAQFRELKLEHFCLPTEMSNPYLRTFLSGDGKLSI